MTSLPQMRPLRLSDFNGSADAALPKLVEVLNLFQTEVIASLTLVPEKRWNSNISFTTDSLGSATVDIFNGVAPRKPIGVSVDIRRRDTQPTYEGWSFSWLMASQSTIRVYLVGLAANTQYLGAIGYEVQP